MKNSLLSFNSILLIVLLVGILGASAVQVESATGNNEVYWTLQGCWINLNINAVDGSTNIDLGTTTAYSPGDVLNNGGNSQRVQVITNCNQGYTVEVEATQFDLPTAHTVAPGGAITDFGIMDENTMTSYVSLAGLNTSEQLANKPNAATTNLDMLYQYELDSEDVPGDYRVYLQYTASTT